MSFKKITALVLIVVMSALVFAGCGRTEATIKMATKPMTEQYILGHMMKTLIEQDTDLTVEITEGVGGGTSNIQPAMEKGEFDLYPEYTGTGWSNVLKKDGLYSEALFDELQAGYNNMGMSWAGMLGFNNTYTIVVTKDAAEKYNLKACSDLAGAAGELTFGANYDFFERQDGFDALCDTYGLSFKNTMDMDMGLKYDAIAEKKIDVMNAYTTDGKLAVTDVVPLKDDKGLYPSYMCGFVVRDEILAAHPELNDIFAKVEKLITDSDMAQMNYRVEGEGAEPEAVAAEFLKEKGLLK